MNSYNFQKRISSFKVDKDLILEIEDFFYKDMPEIIQWIPSTKNEKPIQVRIRDSFGEEFFSTIQDYKQQLFRNDIETIKIEYNQKSLEKSIEVVISFSKKIDETDIAISLTDQKARESIAAIEQGVEAVLNQRRSANWLLYPNENLSSFIALLCVISGIVLISDNVHSTFRKVSGGIFIILVGCYTARKYFKPYSSFETNKQRRNDIFFNWFFFGLIGFIVFATIATFIRRDIFGF